MSSMVTIRSGVVTDEKKDLLNNDKRMKKTQGVTAYTECRQRGVEGKKNIKIGRSRLNFFLLSQKIV